MRKPKAVLLLSGILLFGIILTSCYTPVQRYEAEPLGTERVFAKNYALDVKTEAVVGNAMIRVKDYYVKSSSTVQVTPLNDFTVAFHDFSGNVEKGKQYRIIGQSDVDGKSYEFFEITSEPVKGYKRIIFGVLIDSEGNVLNKALISFLAKPERRKPADVKVTPSNSQAVRSTTTQVDSSRGFTSYELIYSGVDGNSVRIRYREYTPLDLIKPAFTQDLTYDSRSNTVRFKNLRIRIHSATNESISFTVLNDTGQ